MKHVFSSTLHLLGFQLGLVMAIFTTLLSPSSTKAQETRADVDKIMELLDPSKMLEQNEVINNLLADRSSSSKKFFIERLHRVRIRYQKNPIAPLAQRQKLHFSQLLARHPNVRDHLFYLLASSNELRGSHSLEMYKTQNHTVITSIQKINTHVALHWEDLNNLILAHCKNEAVCEDQILKFARDHYDLMFTQFEQLTAFPVRYQFNYFVRVLLPALFFELNTKENHSPEHVESLDLTLKNLKQLNIEISDLGPYSITDHYQSEKLTPLQKHFRNLVESIRKSSETPTDWERAPFLNRISTEEIHTPTNASLLKDKKEKKAALENVLEDLRKRTNELSFESKIKEYGHHLERMSPDAKQKNRGILFKNLLDNLRVSSKNTSLTKTHLNLFIALLRDHFSFSRISNDQDILRVYLYESWTHGTQPFLKPMWEQSAETEYLLLSDFLASQENSTKSDTKEKSLIRQSLDQLIENVARSRELSKSKIEYVTDWMKQNKLLSQKESFKPKNPEHISKLYTRLRAHYEAPWVNRRIEKLLNSLPEYQYGKDIEDLRKMLKGLECSGALSGAKPNKKT